MAKTSMDVCGGRAKAARRSAMEWAEEVSAWKRSGTSARAYALARGISASTLAWWASRGATGHAPSVARGAHSERSTAGRAAGHEFLPVKIVPSCGEGTPRVEAEIVLVGGRRVRVAGALSLEQLAHLLQVVEGGSVC